MNFSDIFKSVVSYFTPGLQDENLATSLQAFKDYLNGTKNPTIRMWVSNAPVAGFQSNTVQLLYQLTNTTDDEGFGYAGIIEVYYQENDTKTILKQLFALMPSLNNEATDGKVNEATVNLIEWKTGDKPPSTEVNLGFTGAEPQSKDASTGKTSSPALGKRLNADYFLRLEPYLSTLPEEIQFSSIVKPNINLAKLDLLAKGSFKQRAYWTSVPVPEPDWDYYSNNGFAEQVGIIKSLIAQLESFDIGITNNINTNEGYELQSPPEERMFEVIAGYMASQMNGTAVRSGAKPVIVVSLDDFSNRTDGAQSTVDQLLKGGFTTQESAWNTELSPSNVKTNSSSNVSTLSEARRNQLIQNLKPASYRKAYMNTVNPQKAGQSESDQRINFLWQPTLENVEAKYDFLNKAANKVLFVQLGEIPFSMFNYFLFKTSLPAVFGGSASANLALQLGKPYFNVSNANAATVLYPTTLLGYSESDEYEDLKDTSAPVVFVPNIVSQMQEVADNINFSLEQWPATGVSKNPAENIGSFIKEYSDTSSEAFQTYYKEMETFYHDLANDKFRVAASYFAYVLEATGAIKPVDEDPLGTLLGKLYDNLKDNKLDLFPGVYGSGAIYKFVSGLLGVNVQLTDATITPAKGTAKPEEITVTGNSNVLDQVPLAFSITFTAPEGMVVSNWKLTYTGDWLTAELPWLMFDQPYVLLTVADTTMPTQGGVGGVLRGLDLDLSIRMPIETGVWQLEGHFETPASIAKFYQMAGGVNLVQALPSPFNAFSAIGVTDCQMAYNSKTGTIEYVSFVMATAESVDLMTGLTMKDITFNVLIQNPGSIAKRKTKWSVMGTFILGTAPDDGTIVLGLNYPGPVFKGQLAKGVITAEALFGLFLNGIEVPALSVIPVVTEFEASFNGTSGDYNVTANLNADWVFQMPFGGKSITINKIGVQVQSKNKALQGGISGGFVFGTTMDKEILSITLSANYDSTKGWVFKGKQTTGSLLYLSNLINAFLPDSWALTTDVYPLKNLNFSIQQAKSYYEIGGETADNWKVPFIALSVRADLKFGYGIYKTASGSSDSSKLQVIQKDGKTLTLDTGNVGYYCTLNADVEWIGIKMKLFYDYNPLVQTYGFTWGVLTGTITNTKKVITDPDHWVGTLKFTDSVTLGSMIEEAISWCTGYKYGLSAPFNILNSLSLSALELTYDFTNKQVSFSVKIDPINLGFCKIDAIGISYKSGQTKKEDNGVFINVKGSFFWVTGNEGGQSPNELNWDASKPETTPAPSGQGNKYFDLRLLALGQHVTIPGFANVTSVQEAIAEMAKLPDTDAGKIPGIVFDPNSSWLVGMDFGVLKLGGDDKSGGDKKKALKTDKDSTDDESGYFIDMQIVFNDPNLYALRIALSGAPARIFKGLDFQILYRKISDSVGVYMAEITLPDVMRKIQLGQVNITLPVFAIEIYTNGDFLVDLGFPKNADFSRSFTLQMIIYVPFPIPIMGSAGLYFGKKSSATSTEVPVVDNGTFNPVLVFGVGIQFGLGYDFNAGILAAGFSLTFVTIIEGVLAKFNPYQLQNTSTGEQADIAPSYYYSIKGVVGIQGKLYGYIDFKIIKAEVNILLSVLADITIAAYKPILLGLTARVSVSVSVKINLGFFSITISFSFDMTIRASYEIKVGGGSSPWNVVQGPKAQSRNILQADNGIAASSKVRAMSFLTVAQNNFNATPIWTNLNAPATKAPLTGYLGFGLSIAGDMATTTVQQQAVYTAMLFIESVAASNEAPLPGAADTSFETLSKQIFRWVLAAFHNGAVDPGALDQIPVSQVALEAIYEYLNNASNPDAMPVSAIDDFMNKQVNLKVSHPSDNKGSANAAYFPIAPRLSMSLPEVEGQQSALEYSFGNYNTLSESYIDTLRIYFDDLAVQMQQQQDGAAMAKAVEVQNAPESLATFIYSDYFLLIARQMIHNAQNALTSFQYNMTAGQTPNDIISWINTNGQFDGGYSCTIKDLFDDNKSHVLNTGKMLHVAQANYNTISEDTFTSISSKALYNNGFTAADLATLNNVNPIILQNGLAITYPEKDNIVTQLGNTLNSLAVAFGVSLNDFITKSNVLTLAGLLMPSSTLLLPEFIAQTQDADTLVTFSSRYGISIDTLSEIPANANVVDLFDINDNKSKLIINELPQFLIGELIKEIQLDNGLQQLSGMASRYYLTGLRLPTDGITPKYQGMWVNTAMQYEELTAGLFSLTGQQFPLPVLAANTSFDVTFTIADDLKWMQFDNGTNTMDIAIKSDSDDYKQIDIVRSYAQKNYLDLAIETIGLGDMFNSSYVHYSFSTVSTWQAGSNILLPYSGTTGEAQALSIWSLPSDLISLADPVGRAVTPRFQVQLGTVDPATQAIVSKPVSNYGWGTQVDFTIKKVPPSADSATSANTYEISGADGNNALILEKMVTYLGTNDALIDLIAFGFTPNQSNGSNPGVQTDPIANLTIGIAQANLSTFTRPAPALQARAARQLTGAQQEQSNLLNKPTELIRLLWQASITRDGGYYLYYFNTENGEGLPDHAFNDKGEAILSLLTIYTEPSDIGQQDLLQPYMNMFVTATPVDINTSTLYAQAAPLSQNAVFGKEDILNNVAYSYFTNIGDVVIDNPDALLTKDVDINVPEGTYMVSATSGETLETIAGKFGTSPSAIQLANPMITDWPAILPMFTALRLPLLTVKAASDAHSTTLTAIALWYGMDLTALANYNGNVPRLFVEGTVLKMAGGPITRVSTVPAGVLSLEAVRTEPADVPANYTDANYALLFLQQNFSILTFQLAGNPWFKGSKPSLPVGPTDSNSNARNQRTNGADLSDKWVFKQSVPYSKFTKEPGMKLAAGLPDIATSPYKGIGYLVQPDFVWLDIYGNKILNSLTQSTGPVINKDPILTGYTDAILGVSQWPSVSSSWLVSGENGPAIQIPLNFDTTQYNGLLSASATADKNTEILLTFTEALEPVTASAVVNYKLSPDVGITSAVLQPGNTTVKLTVGALANELIYTLSIGNIQNSSLTATFDGQATFSLTTGGGADLEASSSIVQQATHDFQVYTQLWYQLTDPNGMGISVETTLYKDPFEVSVDVYSDLVNNWIASIYLYLKDRSNGGISVAAPKATYVLSFTIDPSKANPAQIFELTLSLNIERTGGAIMGDFETTGSVKEVSTLLSPSTNSDTETSRGLDNFANLFEVAMSVDNQYYLKISTGADRDKLGQQKPDGTIWAVRLGINNSIPVEYDVVNAGQPELFAPRPVSNKLESRTKVPIYNYATGIGINFNKPDSFNDFTEIDLDQWIGSFFGSMDNILTPEFTASIQLVDKKLGTTHLQKIQGSKESLADIAKLLMTNVFQGATADATAVQEALKQALLVKLMNLYATNSGIQFDVNVKADTAIGTAPNLYGNFMQNTIYEGAVASADKLSQVTLYFSGALDSTSATSINNYTLTAPLVVTAATLSSDLQSVVLTASAEVVIGTTVATISDNLLDANKRMVQGADTFTVSTNYVSYAKTDQLTISSAKIKLDQSTTQPLAFLLSAPEIVRGQDGEVLSMINLNLSYKGTDIEHQIAAPINGFTPSSWLSFVLPNVRVPLEKQLGGFSVPMFLRSFPSNPTLVNQSSLAPNVDALDISTLLQWVYVFDYSQTYHYPQDSLYFTVDFNLGDTPQLMLKAFPDAFNQLAEFVSVYPSIETDLKTIVTRIDASVFYDNSADAGKLFSDSNIALQSFVDVVEDIVEAATGGNGLLMNNKPKHYGSTNVEPYSFKIQEGPKSLDGQQVQVVTVTGKPPQGVGIAQVYISPETYEMVVWTNEKDPCSGDVCYYYINREDKKPLLSEDAQNIQQREVQIPDMNILQRQDAMTTVYLTRNENLIPGKTTNPDFVYTTGELTFSNSYLPTINSYQVIEIADLPANNPNQPVSRSLFAQLQTLMATLLKENEEPTLSFQMTCSYNYEINPNLSPVNLPVLMQTIASITLATELDPMLQSWADSINVWFKNNPPNQDNACYKFDLIIFSNLTKQPFPLVRLENLQLSLIYILPE